MRRILSIGHSYVVALNRRLPNAIAEARRDWEITAVAPSVFHDELRSAAAARVDGEAAHLEIVRAHCTRWPHLMFYGRRLREVLKQRWDLVHVWQEPYVFAAGEIVRWTSPDTPIVFASFQNLVKSYPPPFSWIEKTAMKRTAGWIAFGRTIEEAMLAKAIYRQRPHRVIPAGVDTKVFRPDALRRAAMRDRLGLTDRDFVVGFVGRFIHGKGVSVLMDALSNARGDWCALLIGTGPLEDRLRKWARPFGRRVRVVTDALHHEIPDYLRAMDLLCAPSQTTAAWREQFGRMLIEAFACGVPVVGSDSGEIPHVIGDAGIVLPEADAAAWAVTIERLAGDGERLRDLSRKGRIAAETRYSWPVVAGQTVDFFEELMR